jgi:hypothetical protein
MPLFGGSKRPKLDGLTKDEEKRRDALNPEVLRRAGEKGVAGQGPAALALLKEKTEAERQEFLWPCLLGWQYMSMRRYAPAAEAVVTAVVRDEKDVRGYFGAGHAYFEAAETKQNLGAAATDEVTFDNLTVDNMYHESLRYFRRGMELTNDKGERDQLREAVGVVEKALAKKAGRL